MIDWDAVTPEEWDVARRVADAVNIHLAADPDARGFVACRMDTGRSDGNLYDTRSDAVRHMMPSGEESWYMYVKVTPEGATPKGAWVYVVQCRAMRERGIRPDHEDIQLPTRLEALARLTGDRRLAPRPGIHDLVLPSSALIVPDTFRR